MEGDSYRLGPRGYVPKRVKRGFANGGTIDGFRFRAAIGYKSIVAPVVASLIPASNGFCKQPRFVTGP